LNRRAFIAWTAGWTLVAVHSLLPLSGCGRGGRSDERLVERLGAALAAIVPAGTAPSQPGPRTPVEAARALVADLSDDEVEALLTDPAALRARLGERSRADMVAGRSAWIGSWLLARSELDAALLAEWAR